MEDQIKVAMARNLTKQGTSSNEKEDDQNLEIGFNKKEGTDGECKQPGEVS